MCKGLSGRQQNQSKQLNFKNQRDFMICIFKFSYRLVMVKCFLRKNSTFTRVQSNPSDHCFVHDLHILEEDEARLDMGEGYVLSEDKLGHC